jgi:RND family efflux transporter MFP subunit
MNAPLRWSALISLAVVACGPATPAERPPAGALQRIPVVRVTSAKEDAVYRAAGVVRAARRAELSTRIMGRVETVLVRAGDTVARGQLLATVERGSLTAAESQATAALELATTNLHRTERLYADSAAPLVQLEAARNAHAQAQSQLQAVRADLNYAEVRAPFGGMITSRLADPGDQANPGQPLVVLEDDGPREIVVTVPDELGGRLRPGQVVDVELGAGARRVSASIAAIVPGADPASPTLELRLAGPPGIAPGLPAVAELPAGERSTLMLPAAALMRRGQLEGVFLFAPDSTLRLRWVRAGRLQNDSVEVVSGLEVGDLVAIDAGTARDGMRARPLLAEPADR